MKLMFSNSFVLSDGRTFQCTLNAKKQETLFAEMDEGKFVVVEEDGNGGATSIGVRHIIFHKMKVIKSHE